MTSSLRLSRLQATKLRLTGHLSLPRPSRDKTSKSFWSASALLPPLPLPPLVLPLLVPPLLPPRMKKRPRLRKKSTSVAWVASSVMTTEEDIHHHLQHHLQLRVSTDNMSTNKRGVGKRLKLYIKLRSCTVLP